MQGIVLTSCGALDPFLASLQSAQIGLLKVVTGWGFLWDDASRAQVCTTMPDVLVRTVSGDGCLGPPALDPSAVLAELGPWYSARQDIFFELGNEPNKYDSSDDAAWEFRYWSLETIAAVRDAFPQARIVAPGLYADRQDAWWDICQDAFRQCDAIGFHAYAHENPDDTGDLARAFADLPRFFPETPWALTEYGIHDPATPPEVKAERYAALYATLPPEVIAACWYHACSSPIDADQKAYQITPEALPYLHAGAMP